MTGTIRNNWYFGLFRKLESDRNTEKLWTNNTSSPTSSSIQRLHDSRICSCGLLSPFGHISRHTLSSSRECSEGFISYSISFLGCGSVLSSIITEKNSWCLVHLLCLFSSTRYPFYSSSYSLSQHGEISGILGSGYLSSYQCSES